jgi:hypothetical protein
MIITDRLRDLIEKASIFWAAEAETCRTYFQSPERTRESDRDWLAKQCFKEVWGSGLTAKGEGGAMLQEFSRRLIDMFPRIDVDVDRREALEIAEALHEEFEHYCLFADAHDAMGIEGELKLTPMKLRNHDWKGDDDLSELRRQHGELGWRSTRFTEGGYCTILSEGAALAADPKGHNGRNGLIAEASQPVYDDEFLHMLYGIGSIEDDPLSDAQWQLFSDLGLAQLRLRAPMRNEQFGFPVSDQRMTAMLNGDIDPIAFDYERAQQAA